MKVGDILKSSWGYEQTNVSFYQVVKATAKMLTVRRIGSEMESDAELSMSGKVVPKVGVFMEGSRSEELRRKVLDGDTIKINSYAYAYLMQPREDGSFKPSYVSFYG